MAGPWHVVKDGSAIAGNRSPSDQKVVGVVVLGDIVHVVGSSASRLPVPFPQGPQAKRLILELLEDGVGDGGL